MWDGNILIGMLTKNQSWECNIHGNFFVVKNSNYPYYHLLSPIAGYTPSPSAASLLRRTAALGQEYFWKYIKHFWEFNTFIKHSKKYMSKNPIIKNSISKNSIPKNANSNILPYEEHTHPKPSPTSLCNLCIFYEDREGSVTHGKINGGYYSFGCTALIVVHFSIYCSYIWEDQWSAIITSNIRKDNFAF